MNPIDIYFDIKEGKIKLAQESLDSQDSQSNLENSIKTLMCTYVGALYGLNIIYKNCHWKCKGMNFYGNHLLFDRLYNQTTEKLDTAAEKLIGLFGNEALNQTEQITIISNFVKKYSSDNSDEYAQKAFDAEQELIKLAISLLNKIKQENGSAGLESMIADHIDSSETSVYLLKQIV
jgi:DNA-binding ferritin-like protein